MGTIHAQRAAALAEAKEYQPSVDNWSTSTDHNSSIRRMQLVDVPLKDYFAKYFDALSSESINKSPYKPLMSKKSLARLISDTQELISCGQKVIFDIASKARASVGKLGFRR